MSQSSKDNPVKVFAKSYVSKGRVLRGGKYKGSGLKTWAWKGVRRAGTSMLGPGPIL